MTNPQWLDSSTVEKITSQRKLLLTRIKELESEIQRLQGMSEQEFEAKIRYLKETLEVNMMIYERIAGSKLQ